ncbi:hypothetical protein BF28_5965 (plasmid) [Bacillus cereus E33L]|uniref:Uncharacterized protein n=1 Tax=Bacillus cereus (strain ZK / E33L) TaxID=288681 RepID=Q4V0Y7_BACCZ|nr:hypothetical protein pE33L54_0014 [Bacillus cereus E33L]AJI25929.1 hypothetical protein BF28_5965 [Bacillus cereus E33L]
MKMGIFHLFSIYLNDILSVCLVFTTKYKQYSLNFRNNKLNKFLYKKNRNKKIKGTKGVFLFVF